MDPRDLQATSQLRDGKMEISLGEVPETIFVPKRDVAGVLERAPPICRRRLRENQASVAEDPVTLVEQGGAVGHALQ